MRHRVLLIFISLLLGSNLWAQPEMIRLVDEGAPFFYCDVGNKASSNPDLSTMAISIKVPFDELQFVKTSDALFQAEVELTFIVYDSDNDQVEGKSFKDKITVDNYKQTNSNKIYYSFATTIDLPPDEYSLLCQVTDMDSKKSGNKKQKIVLKNYETGSLNVSDLFVQSRGDLNKTELDQIKSLFSKLISESVEYLVASFQIYSPHQTDFLKIKYHIRDFRKKIIQEGKFKIKNMGFGTKLNIPVLKKYLAVGNYRIKLEIDDSEEKIDVNDVFRTHVANLPITIGNLDKAIEQMRYIADKSDIKRLKNTPEDQRQAAFDDYWRQNDPTPGTETNELMDEYYRRVAFSNANFSVFREGWKTDMGMIYIIFGPPNDVERQPFNVNSNPYLGTEVYAYEMWYYYDINRRFDFADERGFGDFRLLNPNDMYIYR